MEEGLLVVSVVLRGMPELPVVVCEVEEGSCCEVRRTEDLCGSVVSEGSIIDKIAHPHIAQLQRAWHASTDNTCIISF